MPGDPSDIVEVFDMDGVAPEPLPTSAHAGPDRIDQGQKRPPVVIMGRWPWWRRNDPIARGLTLIGVAGLAVAAVAGYGALREHPGTQYFINEKLAPVPAVTVDALGCPRGATCQQVPTPAALGAGVLRIVPTGRLTYALETMDVTSKRVYRREVDVAAPQTTLRFVSQCVPGSGVIPAQQISYTVESGRKRFTEVIPGADGCSLLTEADTTRSNPELGGHSLDQLLALVANDPALMVSP